MKNRWIVSCLIALIALASRIHADEATFPKQELGVRPPVLKGIAALSEKELREGWIRLFDGVSLYGWRAMEGKFEARDGILANDPDQAGVIRFGSRFVNGHVTGERRRADGNGDWTPFSLNMETEDTNRAGNWEISLESGQYRDIKILPREMKPIFDGRTLRGWKVKPEAKAVVVDGAIRLTGGLGALESVEQYADFVLQLEYKTDKPVNSGVFFRCIPGEMMNGYECQVFNHPPEGDYKKFMGTDAGGIFRRQVGRNVGPEDGKWNYLTIFVRGAQVSTWVNGIQTADWLDERDPNPNPRKGRRMEAGTIQLQGHDPTTDILFRNIRIGTM